MSINANFGGYMALTKMRRQGGNLVLTIPSDIATKAGWHVGIELDVTTSDESIKIKPVNRIARGRKTMDQLLAGIDQAEIRQFNQAVRDEFCREG
ncbi:AbrB/MazE/SpoVT family DNA-binding domain-containing protein [Pantoea sp. YR343]